MAIKPVILSGPCLLQSKKDINLARQLKDAGADVFRFKFYKGEGTHPPKMGKIDYKTEWLEEIKSIMPMATECYMGNFYRMEEQRMIDWFWTPARQMQNYAGLMELNHIFGNNSRQLILKRGAGNTIDEVTGAAEYLGYVENLWICERGINTFDRRLDIRWRPDLLGILELKRAGFKVMFDASHSVGCREYVIPMAKAALALGVDGLMLEVRENPEESWSDQRQCISLKEFEEFIKGVQ